MRYKVQTMVLENGERPWGFYEVLYKSDTYKVKRIVVNPGHRLSLQKHEKRTEHWFVVSGAALVTVDGRDTLVEQGHSIDIPLGSLHRIKASGEEPMVFVEVQYGSYLGEDDIIRIQDDYDRN